MSVWDDITDTPREAENLRLRSDLMMAIEKRIVGWTQTAAAEALGLTEPRAAELLRGKISKFSLDALVGMASELGIQLRVDNGRSVDPPFKTYSLTEVAGMVLPPDLKQPERWLQRHLVAGRISGYKVGHTWRMTHGDIEDLIESCRKKSPPAPPVSEPDGFLRGLSPRSRAYREKYGSAGNPNRQKKRGPRPKTQTDCQNPE